MAENSYGGTQDHNDYMSCQAFGSVSARFSFVCGIIDVAWFSDSTCQNYIESGMPWHDLRTCVVADEGSKAYFGSFLFDAECVEINEGDGKSTGIAVES